MKRNLTKICNKSEGEELRGRGARFSILANARRKSAFTLIELVVVIAVSVVIFGYTFSVGSDFYGSQSLIGERDSVLNLLRRARTRAMNNINQADHGFYISTTTYTVFEGSSYASRSQGFDEAFPRSGGATISGPSEVVFAAIEGASNTSGTISVASGKGKADILVNSEGRISW